MNEKWHLITWRISAKKLRFWSSTHWLQDEKSWANYLIFLDLNFLNLNILETDNIIYIWYLMYDFNISLVNYTQCMQIENVILNYLQIAYYSLMLSQNL